MVNAAGWWRYALVGGLLCGHLWATAQEVYTWTDEKGKKHFADKASTPEDRRNKPVDIPPPNVAKRFVPTPQQAPQASGDIPPPPVAQPSPAPKPKLPDPKKKGKFSRDECEALKKAYEDSAACFAECSTPTHSNQNGYPSGGRNNAKCGHCTQMNMPRC